MTQSDKMTLEQTTEALRLVRKMLAVAPGASDTEMIEELSRRIHKPTTPEYVPATVQAKLRFTIPISYPEGKGPSKDELRDVADFVSDFLTGTGLRRYGIDNLDPSDVKVKLIED